jgi:hypothetical protein
VIDKHLINLIWARVMLGVFYEEGRAPPVDYAAAAKFYQKSVDMISATTCRMSAIGNVGVQPPASSVRHLIRARRVGLKGRSGRRAIRQP